MHTWRFFSVKDEAREGFIESLGSLGDGFQVHRGRTRNMHFMPHWTPIRLTGTVRVSWLLSRSEFVSPKERQLAPALGCSTRNVLGLIVSCLQFSVRVGRVALGRVETIKVLLTMRVRSKPQWYHCKLTS